MHNAKGFLFLFVLGAVGCMPPVRTTPPPADATAKEVAISGASILMGVGDIAVCNGTGDDSTAMIVDSLLKADSVAKVKDAVITIGDNAYDSGTTREFALCWGRSWGDTAKRIMKSIHPAPGNHEYESNGATPYFAYFGASAGDPQKGYYAYDVGEWRVFSLNSEIPENSRFSALDRRGQEDWLRADLKSNNKKCEVAYLHRPLYSSGVHGGTASLSALYAIMYEGGVDLVLAGHEHSYERFAPMAPSGALDTLTGITQIIVGTGGAALRGFEPPTAPNSMSQIQGHHGILKLTLGAGAWRSAFIDVKGGVWDPAGGTCH
jgi:3',5'-cyclic AMP phosphodiesterase CpdA